MNKNIFNLLFFCLFLTSCKPMWGTDHGNPEFHSPTDAISSTMIMTLKVSTCSRVHNCFPNIAANDCELSISANEQVPIELNLSTYRNMVDIQEAELSEILVPQVTQANLCQAAIESASCAATNIFDSGLNSGDLTNLHFIFRADPSCRLLYQ